MGWFDGRRRLRHLERHLSRVEQQIAHIAEALTRPTVPQDQALGNIVHQMVDSQAKQLESSTEFIRAIHAIAVDRAAQAMGRRGGKKRAATAIRDGGGRFRGSRTASDCILCRDPLSSNFSMEQWGEHQRHKGGAPNVSAPIDTTAVNQTDESGGHYHADGSYHAGPHDEPRQYPLPQLVTPWSTDGAGSNDTAEQGSTNGSIQTDVPRGH